MFYYTLFNDKDSLLTVFIQLPFFKDSCFLNSKRKPSGPKVPLSSSFLKYCLWLENFVWLNKKGCFLVLNIFNRSNCLSCCQCRTNKRKKVTPKENVIISWFVKSNPRSYVNQSNYIEIKLYSLFFLGNIGKKRKLISNVCFLLFFSFSIEWIAQQTFQRYYCV